MSAEGSGRPLLPQTAQMQSFTFAPPTLAPRENQRNYVFVDEHNRHKRLKVMRACEGCRKRKIKCDAATTNSWPCAACIRLKLNCIPPTMSYDKDYTPGSHTFELGQSHEYHASPTVTASEDFQRHFAIQHHLAPEISQAIPQPASGTFAESVRMFPAPHYIDGPAPELAYVHPQPVVSQEQSPYQPQQLYSPSAAQPSQSLPSSPPDAAWRNDNVSHLADVLGELKIDHTAIAPYITNQKKFLAEAPAVEEYEPQIPQHTSPNHTVRIPPEMMPGDETALTYFDYFFKNIHPYVPVIDRKLFYEQWHNRRDAMSPLLLEAIFACATFMIGDTAQGNKWLALASKHEESFKDVPRLSTIQAMLLVLKARESAPKRGYFYRSWVTIESLVSMAKELDLHEHLETHQMGRPCDSSPSECMTKTRVWHTLFVVEMMIGAPQGRFEFGVKLDTVDFAIPRLQDDPDHQVFRQFMYFALIVKNIEFTNSMHGRLRKVKKDWMNAPEFVQHNQDYVAWLRDLPQDLQVVYPTDGSYPWIPSHFIANLHCYHNLGIIMHHRPQLHFLHDINDPSWKSHMILCYTAAKNMCRLQEAILQQYGLQGLLSMQRGISFTIYAVLTCTMLHLVAITSPEPELNRDARDFFVRHMRILEQVTPSWPMPEMHEQINALRTAFSSDTSKPFELKPSFPFGSPQVQASASPMSNEDHYRPRGPGQSPPMEQPGQVNYNTHPITPPISAHDSEPKADSPVVQSLVMMSAGQRPPPASLPVQEPVQWNPKGIFDHWNTAFGTPPPSTSSQPSPPLRPPPPGTTYEVRTPQDTHPPGFPPVPNVSVSPHSSHVPTVQPQLPPPVSYAAPTAPYVTPTMWQDVVASSFGDGVNKRRWDYGQTGMVGQEQMAKRVR